MIVTKRICALTMVRNDDFFLKKWVSYYGDMLGKENLFIFYDGEDQIPGDFCAGTHCQTHPKIGTKVVKAEKERLKFLSSKAAELLASGYDIVIGVDADEFIVVDPRLGMTLPEYLSRTVIGSSLSPLGLDFGQKTGEETDITDGIPFLNQRRYAQIGPRYTKTSIITKPCTWGAGFHRIKGRNFHIGKDLYMLHFGYSDLKRLENRISDRDRISQGWEKHIRKRSRTIHYVSTLPARDFDRWTRFARICQSIVRQPHSWNKPAMLEMRIVVRMPDRFKDIV